MSGLLAAARPGTAFPAGDDGAMPAAQRVGWAEYLSMMFVASVYSAAITAALRSVNGDAKLLPGESDPGSAITQFFALGVVLLWMLARVRTLSRTVRDLMPYLAIAALCFASVLWSGFPLLTVRRSVTLTTCILYGAYMHDRLGLQGMIRLYYRTALGLAAASIVVYFAVPGIGRDTLLGYENAMRGVFAAKNSTGMAMLLGISCAVYLGSLTGVRRAGYVVGLLVLFGALLMTRSATSTLIALAVIGLGARLWTRNPTLKLLHGAAVAAVILVGVFSVLFWPEALFAVAGRDSSFTGRVPLWQESLKLIGQRPWLGYAYSAFWTVDNRDVRYLWKVIDWEAPNAHDGYLDILLQIGICGLALYMALWLRILTGAVRRIRAGSLPEAPWMLLFMAVNVLLNIDEGPLPYPDEFTLFVAACTIALARSQTRPVRRGNAVRPGVPAPAPS